MTLPSHTTKVIEKAITRERACDGKRAYRTPDYAEAQAEKFSKLFGTPQQSYQCVFCHLYHVATRK